MRSPPRGKFYRANILQKSGYPQPHVPGYGQTELKILHDSDGYYVGTEYRLTAGALTPYTRESKYFSTEKDAIKYLGLMQGDIQLESSMVDMSDLEVFDICDVFFDMLENRFDDFDRPQVTSTRFTNFETSLKDLMTNLISNDDDRSSHKVIMDYNGLKGY